MRKLLSACIAFSIVAYCTVFLSCRAVAEVRVIGATVDNVDIGEGVPDNRFINIPECVTLVVRAGTKFRELHGPYKGRLSAYKDPGKSCTTGGAPGDDRNARASFFERETAYDQFFRAMCEKYEICDDDCTAVFQLISNQHKRDIKFQCVGNKKIE